MTANNFPATTPTTTTPPTVTPEDEYGANDSGDAAGTGDAAELPQRPPPTWPLTAGGDLPKRAAPTTPTTPSMTTGSDILHFVCCKHGWVVSADVVC